MTPEIASEIVDTLNAVQGFLTVVAICVGAMTIKAWFND